MAMRVPQYERNQVVQARQPVGVTPRQSGFGQVAKGVADVGRMFDQWQADVDEADAKAADTRYSDLVRKALYEDGSGYLYAQGGDALARRKEAAEALQKSYDDILGGLSPRARDMVQSSLESRRQSALTSVDRHAGGERIGYLNGQADARVKSAIDDAVIDPAHIGRSLSIARNEIRETGARNGWSPEETAAKVAEAEGSIHGGIVTRLANVNPQTALDYLNANRDSMKASDVARLEGALLPEAKRRHGRQIGAAALSGDLPQHMVAARNYIGMNETQQRETLQKFLAEGGSSIDPSKTAWCAAFVNATLARAGNGGTGSNMARSFLDWGAAVNEPQMGDVVVLERGKPPFGHVGFFAGFAPDGSIQILGGNQGGAAQGGGAVSVSTYPASKVLGYRRADGTESSGSVGNGMADLVRIEDPDVRAAAIQEFQLLTGVAQQQQKAAQGAAQQAGFSLIESGGDIDSLSLDQKLAIGQEGMSSLRTYQGKVRSGEPVTTDPELFVELTREAATDPSGFASRDPLEWRNRLSDSDFKSLAQKQAEILKGETNPASAATISTINTVTKDLLVSAGIDDKKKSGAQQVAKLQEGLLRWSQSFQAQNGGRMPTHLEVREQANAMLLPVVIDPPGLFNSVNGRAFDIEFDGVTPADIMDGSLKIAGEAVAPEVIEAFVQEFEAALGRAPTPQEVVEGLAWAQAR
ncbi:TIGR02594 family protein [Paracoccus sp. (in: a-proteobacteria)]|uniref:TIGR02594 family protein n=1 Tax=Paracoccus sp. TaxID=267 RepID=UPI0028B01753|nr:TIGR02594 family protein [Paracoccus sp. (in: a-proteobacteria)]